MGHRMDFTVTLAEETLRFCNSRAYKTAQKMMLYNQHTKINNAATAVP